MSDDTSRLAVLIDADNISAKVAKDVFEELAGYGTLTVKRAYGDWTTSQLNGWKDQLHAYAIAPMQQFAYTVGKNSTDSALIIDAMDLLYAGHLDGFVLVSSDSDFTRLATRLRESGMKVYGLGSEEDAAGLPGRLRQVHLPRGAAGRRESDAVATEAPAACRRRQSSRPSLRRTRRRGQPAEHAGQGPEQDRDRRRLVGPRRAR